MTHVNGIQLCASSGRDGAERRSEKRVSDLWVSCTEKYRNKRCCVRCSAHETICLEMRRIEHDNGMARSVFFVSIAWWNQGRECYIEMNVATNGTLRCR